MVAVSLHKQVLLLWVALAFGIVPGAVALPLTGTLEGTGVMRFTMNTIDFQDLGGGQGDFLATGGSGVLSILGLIPTHISDLDFAVQPIGIPFLFSQWMTFDADLGSGGNATFDLSFIHPGFYSAEGCYAPPTFNLVCTPPGSLFSFQNSPFDRSFLLFQLQGLTVGTAGERSQFESLFVAEFPFYFDQILATLDGGGFVETRYSARFIADAAPEPGAVSLLVAGILVALRRNRRPN
jgi:hypothetical protein